MEKLQKEIQEKQLLEKEKLERVLNEEYDKKMENVLYEKDKEIEQLKKLVVLYEKDKEVLEYEKERQQTKRTIGKLNLKIKKDNETEERKSFKESLSESLSEGTPLKKQEERETEKAENQQPKNQKSKQLELKNENEKLQSKIRLQKLQLEHLKPKKTTKQ